MKRRGWIALFAAAAGLGVLLSAANLIFGSLNQDEGWYLYAAGQVAQGRVPYRDFMFTQGPVFPGVYGVLFPVVDRFGVAGGRGISALFGLAAAACAAWLAGRMVSPPFRVAARAATWILVAVNVYQSYFTTIVKTYSLCAFLLAAGFVALSFSGARRGASAAFWSGVLLALAACTRLSAGVALPAAGLWLLFHRRSVYPFTDAEPASGPAGFSLQSAWFAFGLGGALTLLAVILPFFIGAFEPVAFALFGYHSGRDPGGWMPLLVLKAGFVSRVVQAFFVFSAGCVVLLLAHRLRRRERGEPEMESDVRPHLVELFKPTPAAEQPFARSLPSLLWIAGGAATLVHFSAPFPYDDYQVIVYPLLAAALAATLVPMCPVPRQFRAVLFLLLVCTAASFSSPLNQEWFVRGRDRIWWQFKPTPDLIALRRVGRQLRERLGPERLLLTQDTYLAVEARARVPEGMEMGPFSYYPGMTDQQAEILNVLNRNRLVAILHAAEAPVAAFSGYGLAIASPEIAELPAAEQQELRRILQQRYRRVDRIEHFGQAATTLEIFERIPRDADRMGQP